MKSQTWIEISKEAIRQNIQSFRNIIPARTKLAAIVKSNAYGHGMSLVAKEAVCSGADVLGVNSVQEALALSQLVPEIPILIMGSIHRLKSLNKVLNNERFWVVVSRIDEVETLASFFPRPKIHLKTDTGMGRLGYSGQYMLETLYNISAKHLPLDGIMTHFASTEDFTEHSYTKKQMENFNDYIRFAFSLGYTNLIKHASASASTMLFEDTHLDMVRIGISLYGLWPSLKTRLSLSLAGKNFVLKPALEWKTRIQHIQNIPAGNFVGYGSTFRTNSPSKIAVLPVGYYEGYDRRLSNQSYVLVRGERANVVGRVCMNMTMIDVTHIKECKEGDEAVLIGNDGNESVTADFLADVSGTINYDIVTSLNKEIMRVLAH